MVELGRLVGRSAELALAEACLRGTPHTAVVLGGHAGVGKTRLARELAARWPDAAGRTWLSGSAATSGLSGGAVLRFVADDLPPPVPGSTADSALVIAALREIREHADRLVVVDDAHELDDLSALVVQQAVLDGAAPVLLTVRSGEPAPAVLRTLWEDGHAERIDLLSLSERETGELTSSHLRGDLAAGTAAELFESSRGNPLLTLELVRDALDAGTLRQDADGWRWDGGLGRARRLQDAVGRRIDALGPAARDMVTVLALGQPLGLELLAELAPEVDLSEAERRGLIEVMHDGSRVEVRLGHPLFAEVLLAQRDDRELHPIRRAIADAINRRGGRRRGDLLLVAKLRLDAGDRSDVDTFARAAGRALELGNNALAVELAEVSLRADPTSAEARLLIAESHLLSGREADAVPELETAAAVAATDHERMRAAQGLQQAFRLLEQPDRTRPMLEQIRAQMREPVWQGIVDCLEAQQCMFEGRSRLGTEIGERLLAVHDDPRVRLRLVPCVGMGRILAGRTVDGMAYVAEMLPVALDLQRELPLGPSWVVNAQGLGLMLSGRLDDAMAFVELVRAVTSTQHVPLVDAANPMLTLFAGRIELARGNARVALELLDAACRAIGPASYTGLSRWAYSLRAEACVLGGSTDEAQTHLREAEEAGSTMLLYDGDARRARAWVRALGGELEHAIEDLSELAALQELEGQHALEVVTLHHALRLGGDREIRTRLVRALTRADGELAGAIRGHVDALDSEDGGALDAAAERFAGLGMRMDAAEVFAAAARAHERTGFRSRAAVSARHSQEQHAATGASLTPALLEPFERSELTRREREVVMLAAQGLSNRQIAERLVVSIRTAEGHLHRAYTKLGIADRAELASLFPSAEGLENA